MDTPRISVGDLPALLVRANAERLPWNLAPTEGPTVPMAQLFEITRKALGEKLASLNGNTIDPGPTADLSHLVLDQGFQRIAGLRKPEDVAQGVRLRVSELLKGKALVRDESPLLREPSLLRTEKRKSVAFTAGGGKGNWGLGKKSAPKERETAVHYVAVQPGFSKTGEELLKPGRVEALLRETFPGMMEPSAETVQRLMPDLLAVFERMEGADDQIVRLAMLDAIRSFFERKFAGKIEKNLGQIDDLFDKYHLRPDTPLSVHESPLPDVLSRDFSDFLERLEFACLRDQKAAKELMMTISMLGFALAYNRQPIDTGDEGVWQADKLQQAYNEYWARHLEEKLHINWMRDHHELAVALLALESQFLPLQELRDFVKSQS